MSSNQLHRTLGVTLKTAWFMSHRIREAMREGKLPGGLGGEGKFVEADETYVGGKAKNRAYAEKLPRHEARRRAGRAQGPRRVLPCSERQRDQS